jgi:RNA polymerase sigma-70 factor (ECF subfamily)
MNSEETRAAQLFLAHHGFVRGLALKHAPWPGLADDIIQQVFLEFARKEKQWNLEADVKPLLATMTRFVALRFWRERTHQQPEVVRQLADHIRQLASKSPDEPRYEDELDALRLCLEKLPNKTRTFVDMYYYAGNSTAEIANRLSMKSDTVCRALCRVREELRHCLKQALHRGLADV